MKEIQSVMKNLGVIRFEIILNKGSGDRSVLIGPRFLFLLWYEISRVFPVWAGRFWSVDPFSEWYDQENIVVI